MFCVQFKCAKQVHTIKSDGVFLPGDPYMTERKGFFKLCDKLRVSDRGQMSGFRIRVELLVELVIRADIYRRSLVRLEIEGSRDLTFCVVVKRFRVRGIIKWGLAKRIV